MIGRNLLTPADFSEDELSSVFDLADDIIAERGEYFGKAEGRLLAALFFEPSTRTRLSFEAAMLRLGGKVIGFSEAGSSSAAKGESIADTIRTVAGYADIIVMRHPKEGAAAVGARVSEIPLINAGDGGHHHPTQTLTDLLTIRRAKGTTAGLRIGLCGDLRFGRTVHSLISAMKNYRGTEFVLMSPEELRVPSFVISDIKRSEAKYIETESMDEHLSGLDVLYMTRVQKERFFNEEDYIRLKDRFILTEDKMKLASKGMIVLHPLPRVNEIATEVDDDPRALYFEQAKNGMYVRMALIMKLLGL